jgi:hypothetical protein
MVPAKPKRSGKEIDSKLYKQARGFANDVV